MKRIIISSAILIAGVFYMSAQRTTLTAKTLFADSQETGLEYVLRLNPDRLLAPCYRSLGRTPKAPNYGGWESQQIAGHSLGHYLSALAGFVYQTGDAEAKEKLAYTVSCIKEIQRGDGYFGGVPSTPFDTVVSNPDFTVGSFSLAGYWVPWYSVHKIYAGLIDAYEYGGNKDALVIVEKMADWAIDEFKNTDDATFQKMLTCEHGGMCKVFADLYGITNDNKYLTMAERFIHREIIEPAEQQKDILPGYHANTQIPKFIGIARLYELTGKPEYRTAAEFFFKTVLETQTYVIGGNSVGEHFQPQNKEALGFNTDETCNTYNMLELAEHIFAWNRKASTADYYELALYNHILASQDPDSGAKTYYVSTKSGTFRVYCSAENSFWCCTGTGLENPERYNRFICEDYDGTLYLNLFIPSTVTTDDGWKIQINTSFPYSDKVEVKVLAAGKNARALKIRVPEWIDTSRAGASGIGQADGDGWWTASTALAGGQDITFSLPMNLHTRRTRNRSGNFSVLYGPLVLAADLGRKGMPQSDILDNDQSALGNWPAVPFSDFTGDPNAPASWITLTDSAALIFLTKAEAAVKGVSYTLKPFYTINHSCYALYFNADSETEKTRESRLDPVTADMVEPGRQQSEIDHRIKENNTNTGYIQSVDRNFRSTSGTGSYMTYKMKFSGTEQNRILVSVYGKDAGSFSITVDDKPVATVTLDGTKGDTLLDLDYAVPASLLKDVMKGKKSAKLYVSFISEDGTVLHLLETRVIMKHK